MACKHGQQSAAVADKAWNASWHTILVDSTYIEHVAWHAGSLPIALQYGGPVCVIWGWVLISVLQLPIGLALAELASSFPLAGGPYFW